MRPGEKRVQVHRQLRKWIVEKDERLPRLRTIWIYDVLNHRADHQHRDAVGGTGDGEEGSRKNEPAAVPADDGKESAVFFGKHTRALLPPFGEKPEIKPKINCDIRERGIVKPRR
jgi:hypothetical protein